MASGKLYQNDANGIRFAPGGMNTTAPPDAIKPGQFSYLQNVRAFLQERIVSRAPQTGAVLAGFSGPVYTTRVLNDSTLGAFTANYVRISGAAAGIEGNLYVDTTLVASGLSGNPFSMVPFRPDASVQPWMYVADVSETVTLRNGFQCFGMVKTQSNAIIQKWGIEEPQVAPQVGTAASAVSGSGTLEATAYPWTNVGGANSSYNYGQTNIADGTAPLLITSLSAGSTVVITSISGSATVNGVTVGPETPVANATTFPGWYVYPGSTASTPVVIGAFTDGAGNIVTGTMTAPNPVAINIGHTLVVPQGAIALQIGIDSSGDTFSANSGSFTASWTVNTSDVATVVSTLGMVTAYYWGDSPHSGPVSAYIWRNPNDSGTGIPRTIGNAAGSVTNNSWQFDSSPEDGTVAVEWDTLAGDGTVGGSLPLFTPALEPEGFQDFNVCIVGNLFIPAPGTYEFTFSNKDQIMVGMGGGASGAGATGLFGQTKSVVNDLPLVYVSVANGEGGAVTQTVPITFTESGTVPVEIDWDYWEHTGRKMIMTVNNAVIPPIASNVRTNSSYVYTYRASTTGATSNPSPASTVQSSPVLGNTIIPTWSPDPQVDKVDYYRQDSGLANYTYVATGPNTNPPTTITDSLTDLDVANNQELQFDNFEPFPSIDLPRSGTLNATGNILTWESGDLFNIRWLPGTVISIGLPAGVANPTPPQIAYTLVSRPSSTTSINLPGVQSGIGLVWNINQPLLAAQPVPSVWGPTDNTAYMFGCGDPLRPGTLYFTKANSPDSAPDTNQIEVTSPSEPLMNGAIISGIGMVFSTERAWLIYPTYTQALATTIGVTGAQFSLIESITNRGLYIRTCICIEGGHTVFFRGKDGIYASPGGAGSVSLTDDTIYNLFSHEGTVPQPVQIGPYTVYPPDDTKPNAQQLAFANGYLYYDYEDSSAIKRTLVYDVIAKGWSVDVYAVAVGVHALEEGPSLNGVLMGCVDGSLRNFLNNGTEGVPAIVATPSVNNGQARAFKTLGDIFVKAQSSATAPITPTFFANQYQITLNASTPPPLVSTGALAANIIDFSPAPLLIDVAAAFQWTLGSTNYLDLWQPSFTPLPASTANRETDWDDLGAAGNKFIQGGLIEADSFNTAKTFTAQRSDDLATFIPNEAPFTFNGQSIQAFTFTPPFLAHSVRRIARDSVPWRAGPEDGWKFQWLWKPYPEATMYWATEGITHGLKGFQYVYQVNLAYVALTPVTLTVTYNNGNLVQSVTSVFPATVQGLNPTKVLQKLPANKGKVYSYTLTSSQPFYLWQDETEVWVHQWGETTEYRILTPFGGSNSNYGGAEV